MTLIELIKGKAGYQKQSANSWEGPCPKCGNRWRFIVWVGKDVFKCQACEFKGDLITYLREVEGYSCREAFTTAGKDCGLTDCRYFGKCSGLPVRSRRRSRSVAPLAEKTAMDWQPRPAEDPKEIWQRRAVEFVAWAHDQLLGCPDKLDYLASRGLPLEAVKRYRLGWNPGEMSHGKPGPLFRRRSAWGLDKKWNEETKQWVTILPIQRGIIIPSFQGEAVYRIRIRRPDEDLVSADGQKKPAKYLFLEGSGKGLVIRNPKAKAFIVVESDLDDLLIHHLAGDLICPVALTSCSIRPDAEAADTLAKAECILNALDYDPRTNPGTGRYENPGGQNAAWWQKHFPRSERWPVPVGKDPGDAWKEGVDLRQWVLEGLPIPLQPQQALRVVNPPKVRFDAQEMQQVITDTFHRVNSGCPPGVLEWLEEYRPDVVLLLTAAEKAVDAAYASEEEPAIMAALSWWEHCSSTAINEYAQANSP